MLEIKHVSVDYRAENGTVHALSDVSLTLERGQILGLAGESGSGKSTLGYAITRLLKPPAEIVDGEVLYHSRASRQAGAAPNGAVPPSSQPVDILTLAPGQLRALRWKELAIVFQSAMNALNPVLRIHDQLTDVIRAHLRLSRQEATDKAAGLLDLVGIPRSRLRAYPHELSGGMRQRVMIAMALATDPEVVIMDEPTTALDVVVQREILSQILELKETLGFAILFITHDLSLLLELANRIAVMYAGQLMEIATAAEIHHEAAHPYTKRLLRSFPSLRGPRRDLTGIPGTPPDLLDPPPGCPFLPRCLEGTDECAEIEVRLAKVRTSPDPSHVTACPFVLPDELAGTDGTQLSAETGRSLAGADRSASAAASHPASAAARTPSGPTEGTP